MYLLVNCLDLLAVLLTLTLFGISTTIIPRYVEMSPECGLILFLVIL